jgi:hypothetical protein
MHPVYAVATPDDVRLGGAYFEELARLAPQHGFGFVGRKLGVSRHIMDRRASGGVPVELPRQRKSREGDAQRERAEPAPASDADLAHAERDAGDGDHYA